MATAMGGYVVDGVTRAPARFYFGRSQLGETKYGFPGLGTALEGLRSMDKCNYKSVVLVPVMVSTVLALTFLR